ncbi:MAG: tetratricopeptide repeat protein [Betaproteobacteria bacterium]
MMVAVPASRNAPCPCGSGRRYKDCHGALAAAGPDATAAASGDGEVHFNRGNVLRERGDVAGAIAAYEAALAADPGQPATLNNLGLAHAAAGDAERAAASFRAAVDADPDNADALANLADALFARGEFAATEQLYARLFALRPDLPAYVHAQRGDALRSLWRLADAETWFRSALAAAPGDLPLLIKVAEVAIERGRYADALPVLIQIVLRAPDDAWAHVMVALSKLHLCEWTGLDAEYAWLRRFFDRHPDGSATPPSPLSIMNMPLGPAAQLAAARGWARAFAVPDAPPPKFDVVPAAKLRIGFLSSDLREHALVHLALLHWEHLRGGRLETFAYSLLPDAPGEFGERIRNAFDHYVNVAHESAAATAERIRADDIAVLFDCNGHSAYARTEVLARRAAPLQVNYLGCPSTLGAPWWDFILADAFALPPAHERWFDEKPLRMPHSMFPCDTTRALAATAPRSAHGLPDDAFVFCSFNANYKLLPDVFAIWMRALRAVGGSVLWLLGSTAEARANLAREAARHGVAPERLVFAAMVSPSANLARHAAADLYLDTFPYGGGASAGNALFAGLPVLTCAGETLASRLAGSQLHAAGLPELVTADPAAYEALAIELARDGARLRGLRDRLAANHASAPLFDMRRYSRDFEDAVLAAWSVYRTGRGSSPLLHR